MCADCTVSAGKGYTSLGVATAITRIYEATYRGERVVLPVSTLMTGKYGIGGLYLSLPSLIGAGGVLRILISDLAEDELTALHASAYALRQTLKDIESGLREKYCILSDRRA